MGLKISCRMTKLDFCISENKDADQLCSYCTADQHLCFRFTDSAILLLLTGEISSFLADRGLKWLVFMGSKVKFSLRNCKHTCLPPKVRPCTKVARIMNNDGLLDIPLFTMF